MFFSPAGILSLKENFPEFEQKEVAIGGFGEATCQAIIDAGFELNFRAPTQTAPSMTMAMEEYIAAEFKKSKKKSILVFPSVSCHDGQGGTSQI